MEDDKMEINNVDIHELARTLTGKEILIKNNIALVPNHVGVVSEMIDYEGKVVTIKDIIAGKHNGKNFPVFTIQEGAYGYDWEFSLVEAFIDEKVEDDNSQESFKIKKGDLVKIKKQDIQHIQTGIMYGLPTIQIKNNYILSIDNDLLGKELIVTDIIENTILPYYIDDDYNNTLITKDMVELVKQDYITSIKNKKRKTQKDKKILDDLQTIDEMKSKVNIKDFKKIYASSLKAKPNDLKGVELVLHQWANNKKHLYKMLGNELSIRKTIEYKKSEGDIQGEIQKIYKEFPVTYYVLTDISNREILNNKLDDYYDRNWCNYLTGVYCPGTKISKLLNDACKNDKLNTLFSDIIAQNRIKGVIEISINPIEILLMSTNVSGWNSCHRINNIGKSKSWGQYSAGIFSYMCDSTSMIAFRHDDKLYDFKIYKSKTQQHSKNWRQMIWINKEMTEFITSRQYPCQMEEITKNVREMLEGQINKYIGEFTWVHSTDMDKIKNEIYDYEKTSGEMLHYNDMLHGYTGDLCYKKENKLQGKEIKVGTEPICPLCGKRRLTRSGIPFCYECRIIVNKF